MCCIAAGDDCNESGTSLDNVISLDPHFALDRDVFGDRTISCSDYSEISRCDAFVFGTYDGAYVSCTGDLSDVDFAGMAKDGCYAESIDQYYSDVSRDDAL